MSKKKSCILSREKINKIIKRMAIQVIENNHLLDDLYFIGINGQGHKLAEILAQEIQKYSKNCKCTVGELIIEKSNPVSSKIELDLNREELDGKTLLLVDDVMNTGRTQAYSISYLLQVGIQKLETAILVDRSHKLFPISATYCGISLSTTLDEHVEVKLEGEVGAYLY